VAEAEEAAAVPPKRNAIIAGGVGSTLVSHQRMMTTAATTTVCARIDSGTVYHFWPPSLIDGFTTSPNKSRATG